MCQSVLWPRAHLKFRGVMSNGDVASMQEVRRRSQEAHARPQGALAQWNGAPEQRISVGRQANDRAEFRRGVPRDPHDRDGASDEGGEHRHDRVVKSVGAGERSKFVLGRAMIQSCGAEAATSNGLLAFAPAMTGAGSRLKSSSAALLDRSKWMARPRIGMNSTCDATIASSSSRIGSSGPMIASSGPVISPSSLMIASIGPMK